MKKPVIRLLALLLLSALLAGCGQLSGPAQELLEIIQQESGEGTVTFDQMVYARPDLEEMENILAKACQAAAGEDFRKILQGIYDFYDVYDAFDTNYALADIHYCADLTNEKWEEEYNFCVNAAPQVDAMLEELYYALAKSPCLAQLEDDRYFGQGYFDSYQGQNLWDEEFTALLEQEAALVSRYYELSDLGNTFAYASEEYYDACFADMAQVLAQLVLVRQEIARYWGYDDFAQFAADNYYYRDYDLDQTESYLLAIREELVPLYVQFNENFSWEDAFTFAPESQTYDWLRNTALSMGGSVAESFRIMDQSGLYDISYSENKYPASFETYLVSYQVPFVFMNATQTEYDYLTFAHEFGHFCNDHVSWGSYAGMDVQEFFSQGMEYLSLCYGEDTERLRKMKMAESLATYVEQAGYAVFELELYRLPADQLNPEGIRQLYDRVAADYGFASVGYDSRDFIAITHFFTDPMYILSYVVSNDAAMQLYQMETESPGTGLACFEANLGTEEYYFLSFLQAAGLESPFAQGRLEEVKQTFERILH